jgi:hypothetical protein
MGLKSGSLSCHTQTGAGRLLRSQQDDGVNPCGSAEWNERGERCDRQQHDPAGGEGRNVVGAHPKQEWAQERSRGERERRADDQAEPDRPSVLREDQSTHPPSVGTKCDSDPDLAAALCHECTEHPEYAHASRKNRNEREQDQREHMKFEVPARNPRADEAAGASDTRLRRHDPARGI